MDLNVSRALAESLMAEHGVPSDWTFAFDNATTRLGACSYKNRRISLSRHYTAHATEEQVRDTILHEIAHVLAGPAARHGLTWKAIASRLGATPKACATNPFVDSEGEVRKRLAKVEGKPFYRVSGATFAGRRYRILRENDTTYSLVDEEGRTLRASKSLVYPDGQPEPTREDRRVMERQENLAAVAGRPIVRLAIRGFQDDRYAILTRARGRRGRHTLVDLATGNAMRAAPSAVRHDNDDSMNRVSTSR